MDRFLPGRRSTELQSENPQEIVPSADINGHGTRLASIAAGNRNLEEGVSGAAPEAELVIVKLKPAKESSQGSCI